MKRIIVLIGMVFVFLACTGDFREINTDKSGVTDEDLQADYNEHGIRLGIIQQGIYFNYDYGKGKNWPFQLTQNLNADMFSGYMHDAKPLNGGSHNSDYNLQDGWNSAMWGHTYEYVFPQIYQSENATRDRMPAFFGITKILKVEVMHRVTDYYGPIVYSHFADPEARYMPDTQKEVYSAFFCELDTAVAVLSDYIVEHPGASEFARFDMLLDGDYDSWIKFANSLRLRLALHLAYVDETKAKSEAQLAIGNSYGLMNVKSDLAELQHITPIATYESPLYILKGWDDICMGATLDSYMNGYQDPRLSAYFEAGTGRKYRGIRAGMSKDVSKDKYITGIFAEPQATATSNVVWMRSSESYFLLAEYALRWGTNADAKKYYEDGIRMSFDEHGVSGADAYLTRTAAGGYVPANYEDPVTSSHSMDALDAVSIAWDESGDFKTNLEQIITQKYIALYPVGQEAWTEFRRTGYPKVFPVVVNESSGGSVDTNIQIRRLPYPESEYNTNRTELDKGITLLGGVDNPGVRLWWDVPNK